MQEMLDEEDLQDNEKYAKIIQDQAAYDDKILGINKILSPSVLGWYIYTFYIIIWNYVAVYITLQSIYIPQIIYSFVVFFCSNK